MIEIKEVIDIWNEEEKTITHTPGQVMLIDFWATWCPPCQAPMAHNQEMLDHNEIEWGERVRIIGISIDQTVPPVQKHVKAKKWEKVEHFHRAGSTCSEDYGVKGVPHVVLIDTNGKIAFIGHPASRKLEEDIETLLKGEPLKGVSGSGDDDDEEEEDPSKFTDMDTKQLAEEVSKFKVAVSALQKDNNLKAEAAKL
jgi:thiol-disulfide isomerase/thioredoxin